MFYFCLLFNVPTLLFIIFIMQKATTNLQSHIYLYFTLFIFFLFWLNFNTLRKCFNLWGLNLNMFLRSTNFSILFDRDQSLEMLHYNTLKKLLRLSLDFFFLVLCHLFFLSISIVVPTFKNYSILIIPFAL